MGQSKLILPQISFIQSFNKNLFSTLYMPGTLLDIRCIMITLMELIFLMEDRKDVTLYAFLIHKTVEHNIAREL